jgi:hypothetical protein
LVEALKKICGPTWKIPRLSPNSWQNESRKKNREESLMSASEKFLRFAAECETMADLARDRESRLVWRDFAARWNRYAQTVESKTAKAHTERMSRQRRRPALASSSDNETTAADTVTGIN